MKIVSLLVAGCWLLVPCSFVIAEPSEPNDADNLTDLASYLRYTESHNAALAASIEEWRMALEQVPQAKALPDPKLTYDLEMAREPQGQTFGVSQTFPWPGTIEARTDAAFLTAQAAEKRYQTQRLKLFYEIKKNYCEYRYLVQQTAIARQNLELLKHFEEVALVRYATAQTSHPDHIRAEIEIANAEYEVKSLEHSFEPVVARLNSLLNRSSNAALPLPAAEDFKEIAVDSNMVMQALLRDNPEIQAIEFDSAAAARQVELAKKRFYPEIELGVDVLYRSEATMGPGDDPVYAKIGITLPLWTDSYSAGERQARANLRRINDQKTQLQNNLVADVQGILTDIQINAKRAKLYKEVLIPRTLEMLGSYEALYRGGGSEFLSLLDAQRLLLKAKSEYQRVVLDYSRKIAELEMIAGGGIK